jgi:hypothetical protein
MVAPSVVLSIVAQKYKSAKYAALRGGVPNSMFPVALWHARLIKSIITAFIDILHECHLLARWHPKKW